MAALLFDPAHLANIARAITNLYHCRLSSYGGEALVATRSPEAYVARICQVLDDLTSIRRCWGTCYVETRS
jgi:hypothetical protein